MITYIPYDKILASPSRAATLAILQLCPVKNRLAIWFTSLRNTLFFMPVALRDFLFLLFFGGGGWWFVGTNAEIAEI